MNLILGIAIGFVLGVVITAVFGKNNKNKLEAIRAAVVQAYRVGDAKVKEILGQHV